MQKLAKCRNSAQDEFLIYLYLSNQISYLVTSTMCLAFIQLSKKQANQRIRYRSYRVLKAWQKQNT